MASKTVLLSSWETVETSIPIEEKVRVQISALERERDHWWVVAEDAEKIGDTETSEMALLAAERREDTIHNLRKSLL